MASISQKSLFSWQDIEKVGDLKRLKPVLDNLPDEQLMKTLEKHRGAGRNEYPVRAVWNSIIAGIVLGHETIESLRRELQRNPAVCEICGFDIFALPAAV